MFLFIQNGIQGFFIKVGSFWRKFWESIVGGGSYIFRFINVVHSKTGRQECMEEGGPRGGRQGTSDLLTSPRPLSYKTKSRM